LWHKCCYLFISGNWLLHHGNAPTHWSVLVHEYLTKNSIAVSLQPHCTVQTLLPILTTHSQEWKP
jgi:hypothetical protein